ncbi:response regulator [Chelativorans sp. YIM 93263]|uniref:response regulator n=1 Tax=Chelativorans sp. YIM 93263 TaxID=2906648 RepID=UPI002379F797|nr:response regulator transcription factor [Chelativorans sp. YIM 93263]
MDKQTTVIVADDHALFRAGVIQTLKLERQFNIVGEGGTAQEAIELARNRKPDIALLDIEMPGNGLEAARETLAMDNPPKVVMLTGSEEGNDLFEAVDAGAVGYVLKGITTDDLIEVLKKISAGEMFVTPNLAMRLVARNKDKQQKSSALNLLTPQEERTLRLVATGMSNREIAAELGVVEKTVKFHVSSILEKLKVRNRLEASLIAKEVWTEDM